jgi:LDH2 family malate/lactate/ureidoglycolate dehydrogenase
MLPTYDREFRAGRLNMQPVFKTVREGPSFALIDADASLGHPVSVHAMNLAVDKCRESGVAVVSVFNSHHFGAAGCYSRIAADRGVIGMVTASTRGVTMVPTFGAEPVMGTNPLAFAAPARRNAPFELDMATTTVAAGKVKVYKLNHRPLPSGWVVDDKGQAVTEPEQAFGYVFDRLEGGITPLGGPREVGGHKGYGLAVMVHILGGALAGASFSPIRNRTQKPSDPHNIGHFFLAIDPRCFRDEGAFEDDLDQVIDTLHGARRADPAQPVLVAGDPERATRVERLRDGVPVPDDLMEQLRTVAKSANVPFVLGDR